MPIYLYKCHECGVEWKESHGMTEEIEKCHECNSSDIFRKPTLFSNLTKEKKYKNKVGQLTKEFIENSKKDLQQQKEELGKNR